MHPDLERLLSEDEAARAGVEAARSRACTELDAMRAELARRRVTRLRELQQELDASVAQIVAQGDQEVARRRAHREARVREEALRAAPLVEPGVELWLAVVRNATSRGGR